MRVKLACRGCDANRFFLAPSPPESQVQVLDIRILYFEFVSDFGFRISDFEFRLVLSGSLDGRRFRCAGPIEQTANSGSAPHELKSARMTDWDARVRPPRQHPSRRSGTCADRGNRMPAWLDEHQRRAVEFRMRQDQVADRPAELPVQPTRSSRTRNAPRAAAASSRQPGTACRPGSESCKRPGVPVRRLRCTAGIRCFPSGSDGRRRS